MDKKMSALNTIREAIDLLEDSFNQDQENYDRLTALTNSLQQTAAEQREEIDFLLIQLEKERQKNRRIAEILMD
jgi:hypothetical protein